MNKDIAIIGISMQTGHAKNLEEFWKLIEKNETGFNTLSDIRRRDLFARFGEGEIAVGSYLDRIDLFDNDFFKIAPGEAERMDPEQRLMLEGASLAVSNAGYLIKELRGKRIGVFHTHTESEYKHFFDDITNLSHTSHMAGMIGTRVAKFMDWRGPVIGINTSCSSALVALYYACQSVANGDCIMALAGGVNLEVPYVSRNSPVNSVSGQCRPFDNEADGTLGGEGMFCMLVKKAEDALRDRDPVHVLIKGAAMNHGGNLIQNISAPSPVSQAEVIKLAWKNSNTDPFRVGFIEAHGTGTILGDPIEFSGIDAAFREAGSNVEKTCSISSIKGQIGHLDSVAGFAGLARVILALRNKCLPPQAGFKEINKQIDENNSPVRIQRKLEYWENRNQPRIAGINSFGMTGTNVHMVLEEHIATTYPLSCDEEGRTYAIKVGGSSPGKANGIKDYLKEYLNMHPEVQLKQLCYSVNKMLLDENRYARLIVFNTHGELLSALHNLSFLEPRVLVQSQKTVLLIPGILGLENMTSCLKQCPDLSKQFQLELEHLTEHEKINENRHSLILHYCTGKLLMDSGFSPDKIIGAQSGNLIALLLSGKITMSEAISRLDSEKKIAFNRTGFVQFLNSLSPSANYVFILMGNGEMADVLQQWLRENEKNNIKLISPIPQHDTYLELIAGYYNSGNEISFNRLLDKELFLHDLHLPLFEPKRFWPQVKPLSDPAVILDIKLKSAKRKLPKTESLEAIISEIHTIWSEMLKIDIIDRNEDFFELGGSSLLGLDILKLIEAKFGLRLEYADIFDYSTILAQANLIQENLTQEQPGPSHNYEIKEKAGGDLMIDTDQRELQYNNLLNRIKDQSAIFPLDLHHILLTGGTGFLGMYMIRELLDKTNAAITCLVRSKTQGMASERIINLLNTYFPDLKFDPKRLKAVKGDVTLPGLGLGTAAINSLKSVDAVYHLAANVNHYGKSEFTNKTNLEGTINLLEWAKKLKVSCLNHFSTTAVAGIYIDNIEHIHFYESDLDLGQSFGRHIYAISKFKAEQYIKQYKGDLHVNIFRIGNIGGDSETGLFQQNIDSNNFYRRLKTLAELGYYCDELLDHEFETTPVDIVSKIVTQLSLHKNELLSTYHILQSNPIRLGKMVHQLQAQNIKLQKVDYDFFLKHIDKLEEDSNFSKENTFLGIVRYGGRDKANTDFTFNQEATRVYLDKIGTSYTYDVETYSGTILKYCIKKEFIKQDLSVIN